MFKRFWTSTFKATPLVNLSPVMPAAERCFTPAETLIEYFPVMAPAEVNWTSYMPGLILSVVKVPWASVLPLKATLPLASDTVTFNGGTAPYAIQAMAKQRERTVPRIRFFMIRTYFESQPRQAQTMSRGG